MMTNIRRVISYKSQYIITLAGRIIACRLKFYQSRERDRSIRKIKLSTVLSINILTVLNINITATVNKKVFSIFRNDCVGDYATTLNKALYKVIRRRSSDRL